MDQLLDRIVNTNSPLIAEVLEKRIEELQSRQHVLAEKMSQCGRPIRSYDEMYRTAMRFLEEPQLRAL